MTARHPLAPLLGTGLIGQYRRRPDGSLEHEGPRPGRGWHRHGWRTRRLWVATQQGLVRVHLHRRRWRLGRQPPTRLDRAPDEEGGVHAALLVVFVRLWGWLCSGRGLYGTAHVLRRPGAPRTLQRWLHRLLPRAVAWQQALRTAAVERLEPQPVERLFPGGLSPPEAVRRRRWKEPDAAYSVATACAFLVDVAAATGTSMTTLLAEARRRLEPATMSPAT